MANIVITGANEGIGYYLTEKLLADGHHVAVLDLRMENLRPLECDFPDRLLCFPADVRSEAAMEEAVEKILERFGTVDIAVHNACLCPFQKEEETDLSVYQQVFDVNYYGALRLAKKVLPHMRAQRRGKILFTSSGVGVTGFVGIAPYASTKGALEALAKCLNLEYSGDGVTFRVIHPPLTRTKSSAPLPVPGEFMADPRKVGYGIAKHLFSRRFVICPSLEQKLQVLACYWMPVRMGKLLAKMTADCSK